MTIVLPPDRNRSPIEIDCNFLKQSIQLGYRPCNGRFLPGAQTNEVSAVVPREGKLLCFSMEME